ncbi:rhomboid family intramembrane serine protease [Chitinophaga qingshengii]|uniref:Rhomboid family intramembrane serine protease n=1 Tax=Chitinophaga qingshengii TaxID=1569794 RepID=A0ABR7TVV4_9BACT|nr:rhomboid family intramembrane serine protease [Chitinophaga qingshengii]MBC9933536.1 rhomboid family intramembrane serine protease [Chitinophaga qingshengii]
MSISIIIIIVTCLISYTALNNYDQLDKLTMQPYMVKNHREYYRFITSGFVHADYSHLIFNMLTLFFFGPHVESIFVELFGLKLIYPLYYLLGIIVSDIPSYIKHRNSSHYASLGASGAISAVLFTFILMHPWASIGVFFVIKMPAVIYGVLFLFLSAYLSRKGGDNINHDAHFWGAVFGFLAPLLFMPELWRGFLYQILNH